jgi:hypothetical protein
MRLDRSLRAAGPGGPDYRIEAFRESSETPAPGPSPLLKLHGSLNWRMCEACHVLLDLANAVIWPGSECRLCGAPRARPMLIRPTLLKDFRHRVWQEVWREAGRCLAGASRWVFVGYSLPMADVWMLRLLTQSLRSSSKGERRQIWVIDPRAEVLARYRLVFPQAERVDDTFSSWLDRSFGRGELAGKEKGE